MLKTMAIKITEDNYPVVAACLAAGFSAIPLKKVLGCYLVINELEVKNFSKEGDRPYLVVGNSWMTEKRFNLTYEFVDNKRDHTEFAEVTKD
jgi:hypothetical protein